MALYYGIYLNLLESNLENLAESSIHRLSPSNYSSGVMSRGSVTVLFMNLI